MNRVFGFPVGLTGAVPLALIDYRFWLRHLRLIHGLALMVLFAVLVMGAAGHGPQRWVAVGPVQVQPRSSPHWTWCAAGIAAGVLAVKLKPLEEYQVARLTFCFTCASTSA